MKKIHLILVAVSVVALIVAPHFFKTYGVYMLTYWLVYVVANLGLNLIVGYAGLKALGHAAFFGIGAYTSAILMQAGVNFWLALPVAMVLCFALGLLVGFPALRVQMHYLAFATLGLNEIITLILRNEEWLTGGTFGISNIARPSLFGYALKGAIPYYYFVLVFALIAFALSWWLIRSPWGKAFTALRDNPIRAESLGVNIQRYTLVAFAVGGVYAGVAGVLFASLVQFIDPAPFDVQISILMFLMVILGGPGYLLGPVLGSFIGVFAPEWLRFTDGWYLLLFGAVIVVLMVWLPGGLLSLRRALSARCEARAHEAARVTAATQRRCA
ncbi:branched-chain amino acid ABC transporter permease [Castellaniella sp. MT123]|uniref:branched-chain amino acid ABC transporter permease n=1 Tax=Castellaniella sp. MT123 TaxID=3140381 RepID=UPI0031F3C2B3